MFITPNTKALGGRGFSVGGKGGGGYLRTASGYPGTLEKTLAKPPESITVYGAEGGVGDKTRNLMPDPRAGIRQGSSYYTNITLENGKLYTLSALSPSGGYVQIYGSFSDDPNNFSTSSSDAKLVVRVQDLYSANRKSVSFTADLTTYERYFVSFWANDLNSITNVAICEGTYSQYEPYGYKIPILLQGRNLFGGTWEQGHADTTQSENAQQCRVNTGAICRVRAGETYSVSMNDNRFLTYANVYAKPSGNTRTDAVGTATSWQPGTFTVTAAGDGYLFLILRYASGTYVNITPADVNANVMVVKGTYDAATMPPYEPYVPNKTINLYSPAELIDGEFLTVNPKAKTATLADGSSVADLQDWSQDWKLPKSEELTVTTGTTVEPSDMEVGYWSSKKN